MQHKMHPLWRVLMYFFLFRRKLLWYVPTFHQVPSLLHSFWWRKIFFHLPCYEMLFLLYVTESQSWVKEPYLIYDGCFSDSSLQFPAVSHCFLCRFPWFHCLILNGISSPWYKMKLLFLFLLEEWWKRFSKTEKLKKHELCVKHICYSKLLVLIKILITWK